jgi:hypothetical protein
MGKKQASVTRKKKEKRGERKLSERTPHCTGGDDVDAVERLEWDSGMCVHLGSNVSTTGQWPTLIGRVSPCRMDAPSKRGCAVSSGCVTQTRV